MTSVLVFLALCGGALGLVMLSDATAGVGLLAGACLLAILARISQAQTYHYRLHPLPPREPRFDAANGCQLASRSNQRDCSFRDTDPSTQ